VDARFSLRGLGGPVESLRADLVEARPREADPSDRPSVESRACPAAREPLCRLEEGH
jgi:hypothetical protein